MAVPALLKHQNMKCFIFLLFSGCLFFSSCRSGSRITKREASGLDTISDINKLESKKKAIYKNPKGEHYLMRYEPDPRDSTMEVETDTMQIAGRSGPQWAIFHKLITANGRCDSENFDGSNRKDAKISISPAALESFATLRSLVSSLEDAESMAAAISGTNSPRIAEEDRNVRIRRTYLYAYSRQTDEDFHVIIGSTRRPTASTKYFNIEISGLPPANAASFTALQEARDSFLSKASENLCSSGYFFYEHPLKIEVTGSLFFDKQHHNGLIGPASARPPDAWEIHPVTSLVFK